MSALYYPPWDELRHMTFRRSPFPEKSWEGAIQEAQDRLGAQALVSEKAAQLSFQLVQFIRYWDEDEGTSRSAFNNFWESKIAPYLIQLDREASS